MAKTKLTRFKDGRYCVAFYVDGKRRRETFAKLREAQRRVTEVERLKGKGVRIALKADVAVDESAQYAVNHLAANGISTPLSAVVDEYVAAQKALGSTGTIVEACKAFASNQGKIAPISTFELVGNYELYLKGQKVSQGHLDKTIKIYLKRFATDLPGTISEITLKDLQE